MGWFDFLWKRDAESPQTVAPDQTAIVDDVLLQALINGETITREKVMTLPSVNGAVDFISNSIACMPVKLYKYKDGKVEEVEKDDRVKFLNGDTGDTLDAFQMKKAMVTDFLLGKGGYAYIRRNRNDVTGLFYVEDSYITIMKVYEPIFKQYEIFVGGFEDGREKQYGTYKPWQFIKLLRNTKDGASGVGLTVEVSKALETAYQTLLYQLGMVSTGGNKRGFLKSQKKLGQDEIDTLKKAWTNLYANNNENVVVLNNGLEFQEASNTAVESQMNESKKTLDDEINLLFHIYPNDFERTFKEAIYPIVKAFETALNRDLLLEKEKKNHFFEFDVKEIIRVSIKERYEAYKLAKETGFMTLNEIRRRENMEYIEGLDVVNVGLGAVLYDTNKHVYYTPNTDTVGDIGDGGSDESLEEKEAEEKKTQDMLLGHVLAQEFDESGNSSARELDSEDEESDETDDLGESLDDGLDDDTEIDDSLDELFVELLDENPPEEKDRYASPYYDPEKAHEYYEQHKQLKGKKSTAKLNDKGKETAKYVKEKLKEEKKAVLDQLKEQMKGKIDALRAKYKAMPKEQRKAMKEQIFAEIKALRAENKEARAKIKEEYDNKYIAELDKIKADKSMQKSSKKKKK